MFDWLMKGEKLKETLSKEKEGNRHKIQFKN